jgi:hypothetical protein
MRKIVIIILALVVALSALPVTFACYNGGWGHHWGWGNWDRFWRPHQTVYCCNNGCDVIFSSITKIDESEDYFVEPKEVGDTTACITSCGNNLSVNITNAYPGYEATIYFCIKNIGLHPATITGIIPNSPYTTDFITVALNGGIVVGTVIQPCSTLCGQLKISGIPQREDAQNQTFTFDFTIDFQCFPTECETAYAYYPECYGYYAHCFLNWYHGYKFTKWGWTNGPLGPGEYTFDIYAGAAHCSLWRGENIGTLTVNYDGSTATVLYDITGSDYTMTETHLYVGSEPWPRKNGGDYTVAPGDYPYSHTLDNETTDYYPPPPINGFNGEDIYIIAHAVACPE